jgi:hypothetical protein
LDDTSINEKWNEAGASEPENPVQYVVEQVQKRRVVAPLPSRHAVFFLESGASGI